MGRQIDLNKPLTKEDRAYLLSRAREGEVVVNDRKFGHLSAEEKATFTAEKDLDDEDFETDREKFEREQEESANTDFDEEVLDYVFALDYNQVRSKLKDLDEDATGTKEELYPRLLNRLQSDAEAKRKAEADQEAAYREQQHK